ncbi:MAG: Sapep family Mn(2+)-dependent dipeptidase [Immundisolibacter sp.]|uniref:Sapep family Mn(2+)-dependent dipeptidase n=1 Tax=Immundisolibacter sp. TaxID=1934948 RepID=UPI003EE343D1
MNCKSWFRAGALGAALLLAAAPAWALDRGQIDAAVDQRLAAAVADLQAWVRVPSITEAGDPHRTDKVALLRAVVVRAGELGLEARLLPGEQVAVVELGQGENALGILVHADVVPAGDPARWQHPPFSGALVDGAVWGRGSLDDKGPLVASLYALAALKDSKLPLTRPVRLIVGSSEENMDWRDLDAVRAAGLVPSEGWTADAGFPVIHAEKSYLEAVARFSGAADPVLRQLSGGVVPNSVPESAEARLQGDPARLTAVMQAAIDAYDATTPGPSFKLQQVDSGVQIVALGKAAHGARPELGVNAVVHLARLLHSARQSVGIDPKSAGGRALAFIAKGLGLETNGATLGLRHEVEGLGVSTVNLGLLTGTAQSIRAHLNIRAPRGLDLVMQRMRLAAALAPYGGELKIIEGKEALWVEPDAPLVRSLLGVYRQFTGDDSAPLAIGGTTYAKAFSGFVAFGMGFPGGENLAHAENERIKVDDLRRGMAIYLAALAQLAAGVTLQPPVEPAPPQPDGAMR